MMSELDRRDFFVKIFKARDDFFLRFYGKTLYPSQMTISNAIILNMIGQDVPADIDVDNMEEEDNTVASEYPRQGGKSTTVSGTVAFVTLHIKEIWIALRGELYVDRFYRRNWEDGYCVLMFAPQFEQTRAMYSKLRAIYERCEAIGYKGVKLDTNTRNGLQVSIYGHKNSISVFTFTLSLTSNIKSKTGHVLLFDESQDIDDQLREEKAIPMGTETNATEVYIGTPGYNDCWFYKLIEIVEQQAKFRYKFTDKDVIAERRQSFALDGDVLHLNYEKYLKKQARKMHPREYGTQYGGLWALEVGMFITRPIIREWFRKGVDLEPVYETDRPVSIGIDWGKSADSTTVDVLSENEETGIIEQLNLVEYEGFDYEDQWEAIADEIQGYTNIISINADSTGTQSGTIAGLRRVLRERGIDAYIREVSFSTWKHEMYVNLWNQRNRFAIYNDESPEVHRFEEQFVKLQKEIKNNKWSVHHPPGGHDDWPDAASLAMLSYSPLFQTSIDIVEVEPMMTLASGWSNRGQFVEPNYGNYSEPNYGSG